MDDEWRHAPRVRGECGGGVVRPDGPASDLDYDAQMGHSVEPEDWCETHGQRGSTCGQCHAVEPWGSRREMTEAEMTEAFAAFFRDTLDKIDGGTR